MGTELSLIRAQSLKCLMILPVTLDISNTHTLISPEEHLLDFFHLVQPSAPQNTNLSPSTKAQNFKGRVSEGAGYLELAKTV